MKKGTNLFFISSYDDIKENLSNKVQDMSGADRRLIPVNLEKSKGVSILLDTNLFKTLSTFPSPIPFFIKSFPSSYIYLMF